MCALAKPTKTTLARIKTVLGTCTGLTGRVFTHPYSNDTGGVSSRDGNPLATIKVIHSSGSGMDFEINIFKFFSPASANTELDLSTLYDLGDEVIEKFCYTTGGTVPMQEPLSFGYEGPELEQDGLQNNMAGGLYAIRFHAKLERPQP